MNVFFSLRGNGSELGQSADTRWHISSTRHLWHRVIHVQGLAATIDLLLASLLLDQLCLVGQVGDVTRSNACLSYLWEVASDLLQSDSPRNLLIVKHLSIIALLLNFHLS